MDLEFLQHIYKHNLIKVVDENEKLLMVLPYEEVQKEKLLYTMVGGIFIYNNAVLISKNSLGLWDITLESPVLYTFTRVGLIEQIMQERFSLQGIHCTQKIFWKPTLVQPYFLYVYTIHIPYVIHIAIDNNKNRFIDTNLLKQSVLLEPKVFTPLLVQSIDRI